MVKGKTKRVLITGATGQDGSYLAEFLVNKGYKVFGLVRRSSNDPFVRFNGRPNVKNRVEFIYGNLRDEASLGRALDRARPDEIYNLAAQTDVGVSFTCPEETMEVNYFGLGRLVNEAMKRNPAIRIFQASTSEMFGKTPPPQSERSPFQPVSPYGESKLKAHEDFVVGYRERHGLYIVSGISFNHESPRRGEHFVTRKIAISLSKVKLGLQDSFALGNLDTKRDWGFAGDYVEAMWLMLQRKKPEDFVIATGVSHTVRDFVEAAGRHLGFDIVWRGRGLKEVGIDKKSGREIVRVDRRFYRPHEVYNLRGDSRKARRLLHWKPRVSFEGLVKMMVDADYRLAS